MKMEAVVFERHRQPERCESSAHITLPAERQ